MGLNLGSNCPAGGTHSLDSSGDYTAIHEADSNGPGEKNWRWCHKCGGLWFAGLAGSQPAERIASVTVGLAKEVRGDHSLPANKAVNIYGRT